MSITSKSILAALPLVFAMATPSLAIYHDGGCTPPDKRKDNPCLSISAPSTGKGGSMILVPILLGK